jgi:N-acetylmuramoyl-L-alanine amidase
MRARSVILALAVVCCLVVWSSTASADTVQNAYKDAESARQEFLKDKNAQKLKHKWDGVIKNYDNLAAKYPQSPYASKALATAGDLYLKLYKISKRSSDIDEAVERYRKAAKLHPDTPQAAASQLAVGRVLLDYKNDPDRSYVELLKVELNHPGQKEAVAEARKLMNAIAGKSGVKPATSPTADKGSNAQVTGLRHWHNPTYSRVAVDLNREVKFEDHLLRRNPDLNQPMRLYLDLKGTQIAPNVEQEMLIKDGLLKRARVAQYDKDTVRVVLDIQNIHNYRIFSLTNPFRIVVDVTGDGDPEKKEPVKTAEVKTKPETPPEPKEPLKDLRETALKRKKQPRGPVSKKPDAESLARQLGLGIRKVVIDPGHGGKDRGGAGKNGLKEKELTLKVAKLLAKKIKDRLGLEVVLTRSKDEFLTLEERTAKANTEGADLFISIHANAHASSSIKGLETYILNIATDKEAMRVAALENAATKKNMSDLQVILGDLMLNSKISESTRLGHEVHRAMVTKLRKHYKGVKDLGVKQAPFYVLIGANMPSVLLELGFMTNPTEEKRLKSTRYIDRLTDGIVDGLKQYKTSVKSAGK